MSAEEILKKLSPQIGKEIHVGPWLTMTQERIHQFAEATLDHQWIHTDPDRAKKESPYGTTIAHGYLSLSLLPHLTESGKQDYPDVKTIINYGLNRVRFPQPITVGSKIRARTTLRSACEVKEGIQIVKEVTVEIEGVTKPALVAETISRLFF